MYTKNIAKFAELKKGYQPVTLENCVTLTQYVDSLLFKSRPLSEIINLVEEAKATKFPESKDFKTVQRLQAHLKYRGYHDKIEVTSTKAGKRRYAGMIKND